MLTSIKRLALVLGLTLVALLVLVFVLENGQQSHLVFFGLLTPVLPVSVLMSLAFILGVACSLLLNIWLLARLRLRIARQQRELSRLNKR